MEKSTEDTKRNTKNVVVLAICQALFNSGRTLTFIAASLVSISMLGDNLTFVTAPVTMMLVGTAAGTLPSAFLMRRLGRKSGFVIGSIIGAIGSAIAAYAVSIDSFLFFNLGIFLFGIYSGAAQQYRFAAADAAPEHIKAKSVSIVIAMGVVGAFIGPETTLMTKNLFGTVAFEGTFWALMVFCALTAVIILGIDIPKLTDEEYADHGRPLRQIVVIPTFIVALVAALFGYAVMNLLMTATPVTMRIDEFTDNNIVRVIQWHVVGMFAPGFFTGHLIRKFGVVRITVVGSALLLGSVFIALAGNSFVHFFAALFFLGVGWNFTFTGGTVLLTEVHTPSERNKVQGMNDFILFTGLAISSLSAGMIYHFFGWMWVNLAAMPLILTVLLSAIWLRSVRRKEQAALGKPMHSEIELPLE
ncbi:MAG: MFS transporter [Rhodospirillaceae bacterium]|jgi:MFS family permease|nr:MFS transporter [Rhodospirillaceae bacterium]